MFEKLWLCWSITDNPKFVSVHLIPFLPVTLARCVPLKPPLASSGLRLSPLWQSVQYILSSPFCAAGSFFLTLAALSAAAVIQLNIITVGPRQHTHTHATGAHPLYPGPQLTIKWVAIGAIQQSHKGSNKTPGSQHQTCLCQVRVHGSVYSHVRWEL